MYVLPKRKRGWLISLQGLSVTCRGWNINPTSTLSLASSSWTPHIALKFCHWDHLFINNEWHRGHVFLCKMGVWGVLSLEKRPHTSFIHPHPSSSTFKTPFLSSESSWTQSCNSVVELPKRGESQWLFFLAMSKDPTARAKTILHSVI